MKTPAFLLGALCALALTLSEIHAEVLPLKHPDPKVATMDRERVAFIYTMKSRFWADGTRITVFYQDQAGRVHRDFCLTVLDMAPTRFNQLVATYINTGNAAYYRRAESPAAMLKQVAGIAGAVGYLDSETLAIHKGDGNVQILRITP